MDYLDINQSAWDSRTTIHVDSDFYDVRGFLAGKTSLNEIELSELGDVNGRSLLHLQCHFGLDTLSWARRGAIVTGVDLSPVAIREAKILAEKSAIDASFITSDVYEFGLNNNDTWDFVFSSYGAVCWLPDIKRWAQTVAGCLKPGGIFYLAEFHPVYDLISGYPYFHRTDPSVEDEQTYTENAPPETSSVVTWSHPVSEVINALIGAGIDILKFNEYPFSPYNCFKGLEERQPGRFYLAHRSQDVPLVYTIMGAKGI
jgi:SAM-dependent methyltransferase